MRTSQNSRPKGKEGRQNQNNHGKKVFEKYMQEKLAVTVLMITLALLLLVVVLYGIIKDNKEDYTQIVLNQHSSYDSRSIAYRRGDIVDRNGTYLATSNKVYTLIIDARMIMSGLDEETMTNKYLDSTVSALSTVFGYDRQELTQLIQENSDNPYIRYAREISNEQKQEFEQLTADMNKEYQDNKSNARVKGIWFEDEYKRFYPNNSLACSVIGFASGDGSEGNGGIEQYYNSTLTGTNGREYGYLNDESNLETVIKPAINGNTIVSTIDVNVQKVVEKYINEWETNTGSKNMGVIAMNPQNGEILAMASSRVFDLNNPRDLTGIYTAEELAGMSQEEQSDAWYSLWRNYCVSDSYEPGSPSKIFTIASAMEEGVISGGETFNCDGYQEIGGYKIKCVNRMGHGMLTVAESLMVSCNDVMMQIATKEGKNNFYKYYNLFGFGQKTGIDLPGEADTSSLGYTAETAGPTDLATNSFGQSYNCTMVQMAAAYASVLNGGSYYTPHVVKQIVNEQGSVVKKVEPELVRETVSQSTSNFIKDALFQTVYGEKGTGKAAQVEGYELGGKTGTAEKIPRRQGNYVVSFIGFAPIEKPQVLLYVVIDEPHVESQAHSSYASEVFAKIMKEILPYLNVFPATDIEDSQDGSQSQLPVEEGVSAPEAPEEEQDEETQPEQSYADEEFIPDGEDLDNGIPDNLPGDGQETSGSENESHQESSLAETSSSENETTAAATEVSGGAT
ncbi:peptidoglycan D,D-transpeptidase FtsI family protein [Lachnoclostridium edouardi]|uniref:peptidoglycan D,D-transpeptidase FtsI family protein n=1 Tax=Lachnoclostridium edouardi TaxID=1926283 RepID=UPI000C7A535D